MLYRVRLSEDEFDTIKQLLLRWKTELESSVTAIDELPHPMRPSAYSELDVAIEKAENICREFGIDA